MRPVTPLLAILGMLTAVELSAGTPPLAALADAPARSTPGLRRVTQTFRNLYLRTHPDGSQLNANSRVMLVSADEIVMDDGTLVADWKHQIADLKRSGAGGLDTGVPVPSTWYEIYAIRKSSDGTRSLLFHRMKDYFKDQSLETGDDTSIFLRTSSAPASSREAQGLTLETTGHLSHVDLLILKKGSPTGTIWVTIQDNDGGVPGHTVLATSDKLSVPFFEPHAAWVRFYFRSPAWLAAHRLYHIVLQGDWAPSDVDNAGWRCDAVLPPYSRGARSTSGDGSSWIVDASRDCLFRVYVIRNDRAVVMPAGYDQKAKIGQAYNMSTNALHDFRQRDRKVDLANNVQPFGFGPVNVSNVADQARTVALYPAPTTESGACPFNAHKVVLAPEVAYSTNPASLAIASLSIKYESSNTDRYHTSVIARKTHNIGGITGEVELSFPDPASQRFKWVLVSTDPAVANKAVIISVAGYEW